MGRPTKQGIDFFSVQCMFDSKTELYVLETGSSGLAVLVTLWQTIYYNEGYFVVNDRDLHLLIKRRINVDINSVNACINSCLCRQLFDKNLHEKHKILTSRAIQKRYFDAAKRKKIVEYNINYLINGVNVCNNAVNVCKNATKEKEKEKVKENEKEDKENIKRKIVIDRIFKKWNSLEIVVHKKRADFIPHITASLEHYTTEELFEAMENFAKILKDKKSWWSQQWPLHTFLTRKGGVDRFLNKNKPFEAHYEQKGKEHGKKAEGSNSQFTGLNEKNYDEGAF